MNLASLRRHGRAWGLGLGLVLSSALPAGASQQTLATGSGVGTDFVGQRNVIYVPGAGYWAFFHAVNPTASVYSYSSDGSSWSTPQSVFPSSLMSPDVAAGQPSVWMYYDATFSSTY